MIRVGTQQIFRGPRLNTLADWDAIERVGIKTIINLERGYFEWFHGQMNYEVMQASNRNIVPIHLQLGDVFPPTHRDLGVARYLVQQSLNRGGVYIHCLHGVDRTGMVCAMIRCHMQGMTPYEAISEMLSLGFHMFPYEQLGWIKRLRECL